MTNRIQDLAAQAKSQVPVGLDVVMWIERYNQILARLIIDDCVKIMHEQERIPEGFLYPKGVHQHELSIRQHFGVE